MVFALFKKFLPIPDFSGGPVFKTASNSGGVGSTPDQWTKIPRADKKKERNLTYPKTIIIVFYFVL